MKTGPARPVPGSLVLTRIIAWSVRNVQAPIELANKILATLERANFRDAVSALKIAMILLPVPSSSLSIPRETPQVHEELLSEAR